MLLDGKPPLAMRHILKSRPAPDLGSDAVCTYDQSRRHFPPAKPGFSAVGPARPKGYRCPGKHLKPIDYSGAFTERTGELGAANTPARPFGKPGGCARSEVGR